ncbi:hypothetical protein [uncultured Serinicoccus sp.]|uniref:hypothetical protein n=1 Tax=uncultured Serinicoccus sp. TaxID=735514 RepID=UPI00262E30BC|nr:hypothetical protein [uncultured Serinicoccus sp.]
MSTDIEQQFRRSLAEATTPVDLLLDPAEVTRLAARSYGRRRTRQVLVGGMASLAVLAAGAWAGGWLPGDAQSALPASPWTCPITRSGGEVGAGTVAADQIDGAMLPVQGGGTVVAAQVEACGGVLVFATSTAGSDSLPEKLDVQTAIGADADSSDQVVGIEGEMRVGDRLVVARMTTADVGQLTVLTVNGATVVPQDEIVPVPGTDMVAYLIQGPAAEGTQIATTWRSSDGLDHVAPRSVTSEARDQDAVPGDRATESWVGRQADGSLWFMRRGEVAGPVDAHGAPVAVPFDTSLDGEVELLVVGHGPGQVSLADPEPPPGESTGDPSEVVRTVSLSGESFVGQEPVYAELVTLTGLRSEDPMPGMVWTPADGSPPQQVEVIEP